MACVKKRRGKWVADYRDPTGKRHWESYDTRKEAEAALARSTVAIKEGRYSAPNDKRTVADAYDSWRVLCVEGSDNKTGKPLRLTTQGHYSLIWRLHVGPRWGAMKLRQVDAEGLDSGRREREDGSNTHGPPQRRVHHGPIRRCMARADRRGRRSRCPTVAPVEW